MPNNDLNYEEYIARVLVRRGLKEDVLNNIYEKSLTFILINIKMDTSSH